MARHLPSSSAPSRPLHPASNRPVPWERAGAAVAVVVALLVGVLAIPLASPASAAAADGADELRPRLPGERRFEVHLVARPRCDQAASAVRPAGHPAVRS